MPQVESRRWSRLKGGGAGPELPGNGSRRGEGLMAEGPSRDSQP